MLRHFIGKKKDKLNRVLSNLRFKRKLLAKARRRVMADNEFDVKKMALAKFLNISPAEIENTEYDENVFALKGYNEEYMVCTDDEATRYAHDSIMNLFDDIGLGALSKDAQEYCLENFCTKGDWEDVVHEHSLIYAEDIANETDDSGVYTSRLIQEAVEEGVISESDCFKNEEGLLDYSDTDQLIEDFAYKYDEGYDSFADFLWGMYGNNYVREAKDWLEQFLDYDAIADYVIEEDGRGPTLAGYDGDENEIDYEGETYYIYRVH